MVDDDGTRVSRVVGGILLGLLLSLPVTFFTVILGLPIGAAGTTERSKDILFALPSVLPLVAAVLVTAVPSMRAQGDGFLVGILWGLVPLSLAAAAVVVASGVNRL